VKETMLSGFAMRSTGGVDGFDLLTLGRIERG
jgi:hypothetical protein